MPEYSSVKGRLPISSWIWWFRLSLFFIGLMMMSFGVTLMIRADLGVSPWDVLTIGLTHSFGLTVGLWSQIIGVLLLGFTYTLSRKLPTIGTLLNMLLIGWFIDLFLSVGGTHSFSGIYRYLVLLAGIVAIAIGAGMYIASAFGAGPRDGVMLVLSEKWEWSIRRVKMVMESLVLVIGWFLGGPVSIGTLIFTITIGPIMQTFILLFRNWLMAVERKERLQKDAKG